MGVLGSREQLCIHDEVKLLRGKTQTNACRSLCRRKRGKHHCSHFHKVGGNLGKNIVIYYVHVDLIFHYAFMCIGNPYLKLNMWII